MAFSLEAMKRDTLQEVEDIQMRINYKKKYEDAVRAAHLLIDEMAFQAKGWDVHPFLDAIDRAKKLLGEPCDSI